MIADTQYLILVDDADKQWGKMEKMEVHRLGLLHRAFSVFLFNSQGELLLQQRADSKYHSPGLWTNTCCSHPQFGEELNDAIKRRLDEELGMTAETSFAFSFIYKITFDNELIEHEFDHVYFGVSDMIPVPNPDEIKNWKYMDIEAIAADLYLHPERYTEWFKICFKRAADVYQTLYGYSYGL